MKTLIINLKKKDIKNIDFVLGEVAKAINKGYHAGVEFPVNWQLKKESETKMDFINLETV